ncbi:MAG: hypothetical protein LBC31_10195, partial [Treponema sp.]|nr:hypothetical protein [Treponema sp.]
MKSRILIPVFALVMLLSLGAEPLYSPTWGFRLDLPEGYELSGGDRKNSFSFASPFGAFLDLAVYTDKDSAVLLAEELEKKLANRGQKHVFTYNEKETVLIELNFTGPQGRNARFTGWALCIQLEQEGRISNPSGGAGQRVKPFLAAIAYGPDRPELRNLHFSILDSIEGGEGDRRLPGAVTEYLHPRGAWKKEKLANSSLEAFFRENDAAAARSVVEREFSVMKLYLDSPRGQEAWKRFYRGIFKDSFSRLEDAAFILERSWNNSVPGPSGEGIKPEEADRLGARPGEAAVIASKALEWVQGFTYERDLLGTDFVDLVTAAREGRGDCDSRAMLWAIILEQSSIPAAIMVSRELSHAMGLADIPGQGARFPMKDR